MSFISDLFAPSDQPSSLGAKFRAKRQADFEAFFFRTFSKNEPIRILDLGGTAYFWEKSNIPDLPNISITLLNLYLETSKHPHIETVMGDATELIDFEANEFDLVFSNSVIEHLYTKENQQKMAAEIQRVGRYYFIQTPNKHFPVEAHYALPFAQYMPKKLVYFILTQTKLSRLQKWEKAAAKQYLEEIRLITAPEMKDLFPNSLIYEEKLMGLIKSISAHNFKS
jgi:hypothetical protein